MASVRLVRLLLLCDSLLLRRFSASVSFRLLLRYLPLLNLYWLESILAGKRLVHHWCGARLGHQLLLRLLPLSDRVRHTHLSGSELFRRWHFIERLLGQRVIRRAGAEDLVVLGLSGVLIRGVMSVARFFRRRCAMGHLAVGHLLPTLISIDAQSCTLGHGFLEATS